MKISLSSKLSDIVNSHVGTPSQGSKQRYIKSIKHRRHLPTRYINPPLLIIDYRSHTYIIGTHLPRIMVTSTIFSNISNAFFPPSILIQEELSNNMPKLPQKNGRVVDDSSCYKRRPVQAISDENGP